MNNNDTIVDKIHNIRIARNITQEQIAKALGVNRATYINIESGKRKLNIDELDIICSMLGTSVFELTFFTKENIQSKEKLKQIYYYVLKNYFEKGVPKTKLAKLLYLVDFTNYHKTGKSMSGSKYYKLTYGPVAENFFALTDSLFENGKIRIEILDKAQMISISETNEDIDPTALSKDEKDLIDTICNYWKNKNTAEIVNFTHSQKPWKDRKDGEYIPYESIKDEPANHIYAPLNIKN